MQYVTITEMGIIWMILTAGVLGGTINYLWGMEKGVDVNNSDTEYKTRNKLVTDVSTWLRCVVIAIGASFLVPLFLATISSGLIKSLLDPTRSASTSADAFVFFGFCLIGSISSRLFIQTLADKILKEAKEAKQEAKRATNEVRDLKSEAEPVLQQKTEPDDLSIEQLTTRANMELTDAGIAVLRAINHPKFVLRSKTGIRKDSGLDNTTVIEQLNILKDKALVTRVERSNGERWAITALGQKLIDDLG